MFLERCLKLCAEEGTASLVLPQNWLFLTSYRRLREKLLQSKVWRLLARLGEGGFDSSAAAGAFVALLVLSRGNRAAHANSLLDEKPTRHTIHGLDVSESRTAQDKAAQLRVTEIRGVEQSQQLGNPDAAISFETHTEHKPLSNYSKCYQGASTLDIRRFRPFFWEVQLSRKWNLHMSTPTANHTFSGLKWVSHSRKDGQEMHQMATKMEEEGYSTGWLRGRKAWRRLGVACSWMRKLPSTPYYGSVYDNMAAVIVPFHERHLAAIWAFCFSPTFNEEVRKINQKNQVANATLVKVPFDLDHWTRVAEERYPYGLPQPYSDDPTQWIFHGHPCGSVVWDQTVKLTANGALRADATVLQIAIARLLGYRWPAEQDAEMELAGEQREWASRCAALLGHADTDGIVCIPSVRGEDRAADRLSRLLAASYGDAWNAETLSRLLAGTGVADLDGWLRNRFFEQHCKLFHHRPFIWQVWDGRASDGFHALVNYHRLAAGGGKGRQCLESLTYSYLGNWIARQRDAVARGVEGAEGRLTAALELQNRLKLILEGEPPFDIFVRWKPLDKQPIGWNPDISDGVRLNIRPFMVDDLPGGRKGAGILRIKPNIHWRKDRGKEPFREQQSFPWFWRNGQFTGERINDVHLTTAEKAKQTAATEQTHP